MENSSINKRVEQVIDLTNLKNANQFASKINYSQTSVQNIIKGRNAPSYQMLHDILLTFPQLNARWLMTGKGEPLIENQQNNINVMEEVDNLKRDLEAALAEMSRLSNRVEEIEGES